MDRVEFLPLVVGENAPLVVDFTNVLQAGETLSTATMVASVYSGTDASVSTLLQGSATVASPRVSRNALPLTVGVTYSITTLAVTNLANTYGKVGLLSIVPATNITSDAVDPSVSNVVARYDSGLKSIAISPTPLLTATANASGGEYQVNIYFVISVVGSSGVLEITLQWVDRLSGLNQTRLDSVSALALGSIQRTFPIDAQAGTQVLISAGGSAFLGVGMVYQLECVVSRL